jgi:hypothetical protein
MAPELDFFQMTPFQQPEPLMESTPKKEDSKQERSAKKSVHKGSSVSLMILLSRLIGF